LLDADMPLEAADERADRRISGFIQQPSRWHVERPGQFFDNRSGGIPYPTLDIAHIRPVDTRLLGVFLLTPAPFEPQLSNVCAKTPANIHAA
jgi:hypothetical protein